VQWEGEDDPGGSGFVDYTVYVSVDGGTYVPWQGKVTDTQAVFYGAVGHEYGFYSVARDYAGNVETTPGTPDAVTTVTSSHRVHVDVGVYPSQCASGATVFPWATATDDAGHSVVTWAWTDHGAGGAFVPSADIQSPNYVAPVNETASAEVVRLTVSAACDGVPSAWGADTCALSVLPQYTFTDVPPDHWAFSYIWACAHAGIVGGYDDGTYRPDDLVNRGQMAVYVARALAGGDAHVPTGPATATFTDVPTDHWAFKYAEYAYANSIVQGYGAGVYAPDVNVDRAQMAVFVARAMVYPPGDEVLNYYQPPAIPTFTDVPTDFWARKWVEYIVEEGVAAGYGDGTYRPDPVVDRAAMAVYVQRAFDLPM
jgi:hypothetical protein